MYLYYMTKSLGVIEQLNFNYPGIKPTPQRCSNHAQATENPKTRIPKKKTNKKLLPATIHNSRLSDAFVYKRENEVLEIYKL